MAECSGIYYERGKLAILYCVSEAFGQTYTRNTMDVSSIPSVKELSHLPVIADPSHGTGRWKLVTPMSRAAIAAGADGILVEVHPNPKEALSDGPQSLNFDSFTALMKDIRRIAGILGREI